MLTYTYFLFYQPSDWYKVTRKQIEHEGGKGLFRYYSSLQQILKEVYPDYDWDVMRFINEGGHRPTAGHWKDKKNIDAAWKRIESKLGIKMVQIT